MTGVLLGPSILTADMLRLGEAIREAERAGVDFIHLDVMDGHFVPNITFGPLIVSAVRSATSLPLDVHLMIERPEIHFDAFVGAGANTITFHIEACGNPAIAISALRSLGVRPSIAINPGTDVAVTTPFVPLVDQVLLMSVNPGFGGQAFLTESVDRARQMRAQLDGLNPLCQLEIDGGIHAGNIALVVNAGVTNIVAGSAVYSGNHSVAEGVRRLREGIGAHS
jgi:ribulose-phosphate 3-epimerase